MGANISGDDYEADDKEVFQSYRIPPKAYKKKNAANTTAGSTKSLSDISQPVSPTSVEFGKLTSYRTGGGGGGKQQKQQPQQQQQQQQQPTRLRAGSISSGFNRSRRDRPISHPPSVLSASSSASSLNLSIVNAAVAAGSPTPSLYSYSNDLVSAPITFMSSYHNHGAGVGGGSSRTNSGYSIGSDSLDFSTIPHAVGTGLGRATYVNGKMVEAGVHGGSSASNSGGGFYMHSNYTVQDFMSYQQQQQQQFLEQQQYEYQQMMILRQQQQQLKLEYEQKQLALLQQQQNLHQNSTQISTPVIATAALPRPPQEYSNTQQITGVVLQTKSRRPARNPDRALSSQNLSNSSSGNGHHRNVSHAIAIPAPTTSTLQGQPHTSQSSPRTHHQAPRSSTMATVSVNHNHSNHQHYSTSPSGSMASSYNGAASSFSSMGSHYHTMLAMTSAASPPSSASSSLSNPGGPSPESAVVSISAVSAGASKSTTSLTKSSGFSADELAARILPLRRLLGGREYYPDKTLPYLLPCDEQESERLLLQHYVIRYAFGSNIIPPIDTTIAGKVLDCGCGPGTWVMEMATEYEDLDFYGFDISPMYPTAIHPKNAYFSMGNLLDPEIPFASDSYLLVHQRNMLLGLTQDAWPGVVQDLFRCVIPGGHGWLQLSEVDPIWSRPGPISRNVLKMLNETAQNRNVDVLLPSRLDQVLKDVGCENVKMMMVEIPIGPWGGKIGMLWRDVLKAEMEALKPVVLQAALENAVAAGMDVAVCGAEMTTGEEWEEMMGQVWAEMDQYHTFSRVYLAYGQKP
ncbi:hypothetical protein BG015_005007 [Linnemannia schmuckeri]|uniref:Methyltransferase domain-containing protein n=1 Tax=Linnemannia schmuckeri TaxID=64567 RepID=A0A9P5S1N8_9FUNG|nr:hypothetical protein BG015_005007 [Linnemannia schmuckeri]